jgi:hypothetical protein
MHPAQRYITHLAFNRQLGLKEIQETLRRQYIIAKNAELPERWYPREEHKRLLTKKDNDYLKSLKGADSLRRHLLFNREVRVIIDVMTLQGYDEQAIAESFRLSGYHNISEQVISSYRRYFFDPTLIEDIEEFELFLQLLPPELDPNEHRSAFYNPWVGQLFRLNILVPTNFNQLSDTALSVAYSRLLEDFHNKRHNIPFNELIKLATRAQELKARLNITSENTLLVETLNKLGIALEPIRNKPFEELLDEEEGE